MYKMIKFFNFLVVSLLICSSAIVSAQANNKLDSNGKKDGVWKGVYETSKRPRYEGTFAHGKEIGVFNFFDDTKAGSLIATREFNAKDSSAYTIFYDQSKNKVSEGKVLNKLFEGEWKYYHQASTIVMTLENYKNGKLEGLRTVFYPNGKIAEEVNYQNNLKNGSCKIYSENGIVLEETFYKNNQYHGPAIFRDAKGNIASNGKFVNNKKEGVWQFFEKGIKVKETNMSFQQAKSK